MMIMMMMMTLMMIMMNIATMIMIMMMIPVNWRVVVLSAELLTHSTSARNMHLESESETMGNRKEVDVKTVK